MNPIRYRSYYYDVETQLYYLNTRYYDPAVGRFINADDISYLDPETINGLNLYAYCVNNPVMLVDPNGTLAFIFTLLIGALIAGLISGTFNAISSAFQGESFINCVGSFVGGFITGAVLGAAMIAGGGLAVGAITASALQIVGIATLVTAGSFVGGVGAYFAENAIKGNQLNWEDSLKQGGLTAIQGLLNFGVGALMGAAGFWESLKPGKGIVSYLKSAKDFFMLELGRNSLRSLIGGGLSYLSVNLVPIIIRTFFKQIFTFPWNLIKP